MNSYLWIMCLLYMIISPLVYASMYADTLSASVSGFTPPTITIPPESWWGAVGTFFNIMITMMTYAVNGLVVFFQVMFVLPLTGGLWILTIINSLLMGITLYLVLDFVHGLV